MFYVYWEGAAEEQSLCHYNIVHQPSLILLVNHTEGWVRPMENRSASKLYFVQRMSWAFLRSKLIFPPSGQHIRLFFRDDLIRLIKQDADLIYGHGGLFAMWSIVQYCCYTAQQVRHWPSFVSVDYQCREHNIYIFPVSRECLPQKPDRIEYNNELYLPMWSSWGVSEILDVSDL